MQTDLLGRVCRKARGNNSRFYRVVAVYQSDDGSLRIAIEDIETGALSVEYFNRIRMHKEA